MKKENLKIVKVQNGKYIVLNLNITGMQTVAAGLTKSQAVKYVNNRAAGLPF